MAKSQRPVVMDKLSSSAIELSLVKFELMSETLLHCVALNSNMH
jgi:hypothetical protein